MFKKGKVCGLVLMLNWLAFKHGGSFCIDNLDGKRMGMVTSSIV